MIQPTQPFLDDFSKENQPLYKLILKANSFKSDKKAAFQEASNWQVARNENFSDKIYDSWKQHENLYYKENIQNRGRFNR
jgi:hypothetical protein